MSPYLDGLTKCGHNSQKRPLICPCMTEDEPKRYKTTDRRVIGFPLDRTMSGGNGQARRAD